MLPFAAGLSSIAREALANPGRQLDAGLVVISDSQDGDLVAVELVEADVHTAVCGHQVAVAHAALSNLCTRSPNR